MPTALPYPIAGLLARFDADPTPSIRYGLALRTAEAAVRLTTFLAIADAVAGGTGRKEHKALLRRLQTVGLGKLLAAHDHAMAIRRGQADPFVPELAAACDSTWRHAASAVVTMRNELAHRQLALRDSKATAELESLWPLVDQLVDSVRRLASYRLGSLHVASSADGAPRWHWCECTGPLEEGPARSVHLDGSVRESTVALLAMHRHEALLLSPLLIRAEELDRRPLLWWEAHSPDRGVRYQHPVDADLSIQRPLDDGFLERPRQWLRRVQILDLQPSPSPRSAPVLPANIQAPKGGPPERRRRRAWTALGLGGVVVALVAGLWWVVDGTSTVTERPAEKRTPSSARPAAMEVQLYFRTPGDPTPRLIRPNAQLPADANLFLTVMAPQSGYVHLFVDTIRDGICERARAKETPVALAAFETVTLPTGGRGYPLEGLPATEVLHVVHTPGPAGSAPASPQACQRESMLTMRELGAPVPLESRAQYASAELLPTDALDEAIQLPAHGYVRIVFSH